MKLLIELDVEVDGKISEERLKEVIQSMLSRHGALTSEEYGDADEYAIFINSSEVKEVK